VNLLLIVHRENVDVAPHQSLREFNGILWRSQYGLVENVGVIPSCPTSGVPARSFQLEGGFVLSLHKQNQLQEAQFSAFGYHKRWRRTGARVPGASSLP